jgi:hypothetical protein
MWSRRRLRRRWSRRQSRRRRRWAGAEAELLAENARLRGELAPDCRRRPRSWRRRRRRRSRRAATGRRRSRGCRSRRSITNSLSRRARARPVAKKELGELCSESPTTCCVFTAVRSPEPRWITPYQKVGTQMVHRTLLSGRQRLRALTAINGCLKLNKSFAEPWLFNWLPVGLMQRELPRKLRSR